MTEKDKAVYIDKAKSKLVTPEWELTRTARRMKGRTIRIKMLGNSVLPQWAYIPLPVISEVESKRRSSIISQSSTRPPTHATPMTPIGASLYPKVK